LRFDQKSPANESVAFEELELGGLTPSLGSLVDVRQAVALPIMVMIPPRAGDFVYCLRHFQVMLRDINLAIEHGVDGIVFGILNADANVDMELCREVMRRLGSRAAVFHRAFDVVADPFESLERLIDLSVQRVLTSGQKPAPRKKRRRSPD
jgi:copper homeostasis protein